MKTNAQHCERPVLHPSIAELRELLADNPEYPSNGAASHLDGCETCQARLTSLAADPSWWQDVQTYLGDEDEPRWTPDVSQVLSISPDADPGRDSLHETVRALLGSPSHPEMLGRLGRYDIERIIGSGGMGIVLKAHDSELNRPIAVKLLAPHLSHVGAARERFAREGRAAAAVVHEHVVAIYDVVSEGRTPFLVMQYVPGRSLQARVDEDGPLAVEEILRIGVQAASGLAAAHRQGLVHRDVKPSNILLENQVERAVLTDFGLARAIDDASLTQTGILTGTPHYMSPEQAGGGLIDCRSDLFSLGAVLYFMATGHPPFRAEGTMAVLHRLCREKHRPAWQCNKEIPDHLSDVIDRLLEKKPGRRPASATDVQQELAALLSRWQRQGLSRRRFAGWPFRRALRRTLRTAALMLLVSGAIVVASRPAPTSQPRKDKASVEAADADPAAKQLDNEFYADAADVERALAGMQGQSLYLQQTSDGWADQLRLLERDLAKFESSNTFPEK
jgi:eukaryotic-like serine/threonine-protein kinase